MKQSTNLKSHEKLLPSIKVETIREIVTNAQLENYPLTEIMKRVISVMKERMNLKNIEKVENVEKSENKKWILEK